MMEHPVTQGSEAWHILRLGKPTASEFGNLVTPEGKVRSGEMPETYLYEKLAESVTGKPLEEGQSWAMGQGAMLESEAIPFFTLAFDIPVRRMGFITTDDMKIGASPDGLIGTDGGLEVKCPLPQTHLKYLLRGTLPPQYVAQIQGSMWVTGRPYWYFMSYNRALPPLVLKVERDAEFQESLTLALKAFLAKMDAANAKLSSLRATA